MRVVTVFINGGNIKKGFRGVIEFHLSPMHPRIGFRHSLDVHSMVLFVNPSVSTDNTLGFQTQGYCYNPGGIVLPDQVIVGEGQWSVLNEETVAIWFVNELECEVNVIMQITYTASSIASTTESVERKEEPRKEYKTIEVKLRREKTCPEDFMEVRRITECES